MEQEKQEAPVQGKKKRLSTPLLIFIILMAVNSITRSSSSMKVSSMKAMSSRTSRIPWKIFPSLLSAGKSLPSQRPLR